MKKLSWGCYGENDDVMVSSGVRWPLMREKEAIGVMVVSVGSYMCCLWLTWGVAYLGYGKVQGDDNEESLESQQK